MCLKLIEYPQGFGRLFYRKERENFLIFRARGVLLFRIFAGDHKKQDKKSKAMIKNFHFFHNSLGVTLFFALWMELKRALYTSDTIFANSTWYLMGITAKLIKPICAFTISVVFLSHKIVTGKLLFFSISPWLKNSLKNKCLLYI